VPLLTEDEIQFDSRTTHFRYDADFLAQRYIDIAQWVKRSRGLHDVPLGYIGSSGAAAGAIVAASMRPDLASTIVRLDAEKAERLAAATFPIEGLGLNDSGVTWNGLPFEQASTAIRTRVSVAIGAALNPRLKVLLIRNGNDLDAKNLQLLADFAEEQALQIWVEKIAGGPKGMMTVEIVDGQVAPVGVS